jgi:hypothetical protein
MEIGDTKEVYEVFGANMTLDRDLGSYFSVLHLACKSCQQCRHQCFGCRTGFTGERAGDLLSQLETEEVLESLLKVA